MRRQLTIAALALVLGMSAASRAMTSRADGTSAPAAAVPPQQYQTLGNGRCLNCHEHEKEDAWYKTREMAEVQRLFKDRGEQAGHVNSMNQLESPKSKAFLKAVNQADAYDLKG